MAVALACSTEAPIAQLPFNPSNYFLDACFEMRAFNTLLSTSPTSSGSSQLLHSRIAEPLYRNCKYIEDHVDL